MLFVLTLDCIENAFLYFDLYAMESYTLTLFMARSKSRLEATRFVQKRCTYLRPKLSTRCMSVCLVFRSLLSKPKDPIPKEDKNNAACQLNCKDCEAVYVGETKRSLNIRAEEHITAIKSASKRSHTAEHCWKYNHDFDWELQSTAGNTIMTLTGNIKMHLTLRKT